MYTNRDGKYAKLRSIKKNETGVYVIPAYVEKNGEKYPLTHKDIIDKENVKVYIDMAHAWIDDVDGHKHKVWWYFVK